jgi:predicted PurR-regulated permease PerM
MEEIQPDKEYQKAVVDSIVKTLSSNGYSVSEGKIRKVLFSEVGLVVTILVFLFGVIAPYFTITRDIALIQQSIDNINTNHETHIQNILTNIKEIREKQASQDLLLQQNSDAILVILGKPIKK